MTNLLTTAEVAAVLGVTPSAVNHAVARGRLKPSKKLPGRTGARLFTPAHIKAYKDTRWKK